jgi:hypothetical protein
MIALQRVGIRTVVPKGTISGFMWGIRYDEAPSGCDGGGTLVLHHLIVRDSGFRGIYLDFGAATGIRMGRADLQAQGRAGYLISLTASSLNSRLNLRRLCMASSGFMKHPISVSTKPAAAHWPCRPQRIVCRRRVDQLAARSVQAATIVVDSSRIQGLAWLLPGGLGQPSANKLLHIGNLPFRA